MSIDESMKAINISIYIIIFGNTIIPAEYITF